MQLNLKITRLLFQLSEIENHENSHFLIGDGNLLRNNLLKLYRATRNPDSHDLIIKIMSEAGYPWFGKLARSKPNLATINREIGREQKPSSKPLKFLTEREFLSLLPANEFLH